jgi:hypothetical protein
MLFLTLTIGNAFKPAFAAAHVDWQVIGSGGAPQASSGHKLFSVTAQPSPVGESNDGVHRVNSGYWQSFGVSSQWLCGDADGSAFVDIDDVVFVIYYVFASGPAPVPLESGDADCSGGDPAIDIDDVVYLITSIFGGGPAPCANCP